MGLRGAAPHNAGMTSVLRGISSMATRQVLGELAADCEKQSGVRVEIESVGGVDAAKRVQAGEAFDLVFLAADAIDKLVAAGKAAGRVDLVRSGVAVLLLGALVGGLVFAAEELSHGPDLAAGKPWQASSSYSGCTLSEHRCGSNPVKIFFHTDEEDQPWVQLDLEHKTRVASVELVNRSDLGPDRAYPIVVEVSADGKRWTEVARRDTSYTTWRADFEPKSARYVRAKVLKRTWFHLERFSVYGR